MPALTVEEVYQTYIRQRPRAERLRLVEIAARDLAGEEETGPQATRSILELEGLGKEIWEGVDPREYVRALRSEWDHRP